MATMAVQKRGSSARLRAIATALHHKAAAEGTGSQKIYIGVEQTATGQGIIRFREPQLLQSYQKDASSRGRKSRSAKLRATG
jgi:hypothetical protein